LWSSEKLSLREKIQKDYSNKEKPTWKIIGAFFIPFQLSLFEHPRLLAGQASQVWSKILNHIL